MANTVISLDTDIDLITKQRELVQEALGPDGAYIRLKETLEEYYDEGTLKNPDVANAVGQALSNMAVSITAQAMNAALDWAAREKALVLQKEELEYKIDLMKLEAEKAAFDRDTAESAKIYTQAKTIREMGTPTIVNGDVASLPNEGSAYWQTEILKTEEELKELAKDQVDAQTKQVQAQVHKLVADTYVNHGMFTGYIINDNGIVGTTKQAQPDVTLSEMNKQVAAEQAKGYAWNAWSNAASSSAGMIGTVAAAELTNETLVENALNTWNTSVTKLNQITAPTITI